MRVQSVYLGRVISNIMKHNEMYKISRKQDSVAYIFRYRIGWFYAQVTKGCTACLGTFVEGYGVRELPNGWIEQFFHTLSGFNKLTELLIKLFRRK